MGTDKGRRSQWCNRLLPPKVAGFVLGEAKARGAEEGFLTQASEEQPGVVKLRKAQDTVLLAEGFKAVGGDLWSRDGIYYGREAALQYAHSSLLQRAVRAAYDEPGETPQGKRF